MLTRKIAIPRWTRVRFGFGVATTPLDKVMAVMGGS
jgi:hypothetical protein